VSTQRAQLVMERPGRTVIALIVINVAAYIAELLLMRVGFASFVDKMAMSPADVATGSVWQPLTSLLLHAPEDPFHLIFNMLFLWWFGGPLERWWGGRKLATTYVLAGLGGNALVFLLGAGGHLMSGEGGIGGSMWSSSHLGASGCVMGVTLAWGAMVWDQRLNMFLLGPMRGRTFVLILVGLELLRALSFSPVSSASHIGGMGVGWIIGRGWTNLDELELMWRQLRSRLRPRKKRGGLSVIDGGGRKKGGPGPGAWGPRGRDDEDDDGPIVH
jgi:membrane associated rhomboid family serine protease